MKKYELIRIIGDGTYGVVYEGINRETKQKVAIKKLKDRYKSLKECLSKIEVKVLEKLNHENIVKLKEVIRDKNGEVSYIFEYCDCNLFEFIENHREHKKRIPEPIIREIIQQITKGMKYMHSKQYFHRDLKPENILVILNKYNLNNIISGELQVKICDFGTAKKIPVKNILPMTDYVCTRWYRPPECVLRADNYDEKMDILAIGCVMAELYNLGAIFPGENEFDQLNQILKILGTPTRARWPWGYKQSELFGIQLPAYYKKDFKKILGYISKEGVNLLNEIFTFDPTKRPSCSKILNHPYFKVIPKPKININSNSLRSSNKQNNLIINNNNEENNRANNNSKNKNDISDSVSVKQIGNDIFEKRIVTKKISNNDIIENYLNNTVRNKDVINHINLNNNNNENKYFISNTGKKDNNSKYIKINETKSGLVTKKILKYNKNGYKRNNEENKNNNNYKRELIIRRIERIGRNGHNFNNFNTFNNLKKLSFAPNSRTQVKGNIREISAHCLSNKRNTVSSNKKNKEENKPNNPNNKKYNNYKIVDIACNNNHKEHYIKYNKTSINSNRRNIKTNSKLSSFGKNNERNSSNNNSKLLLRTKNINSYRNNYNNKNNHKFYISNGNKNNCANPKHLIYSNYSTYNEIPNNIKSHNHSHNHNNIYIYTYERKNSAKRNIINNSNEYRHTNKNSINIKHLGDDYENNVTPKNNKNNNNYQSYRKSPAKKDEKIGSLLTYFFNSKNNVKNLFEKSKSLIKYNTNNNNSSINIKFKKDYKNDNNNRNNGEKIRINNMNDKIFDDISNNNYHHNNERNYIQNSTSKKDYYRNTKN